MENQEKTRIQPKIFILFVVIGLLPMAIGSIILLSGARTTYQEVIGSHLSVVAENAQMELNAYFSRLADEVNSITLTPDVRVQVFQANQRGLDSNPQASIAQWATTDHVKSPLVKSVLENPGSLFLREYTLNSSFRALTVTDGFGRVVAATQHDRDYYVSDQKWWRYAFREGAGGRFISDINYDDASGMYTMDFALPIVDRATQRAIGVVKAAVDSEEILNLVRSIKVGERGHALLLRGDAVILVAPDTTIKDQRRFKHLTAMRSAIENGMRSIQVGEDDERAIMGLPPFRLKDTMPELDWYLGVVQPRAEALSLFSNINTKFFYIILFTVLVVGLMSVFFSWVLAKPIIETDPHLERL